MEGKTLVSYLAEECLVIKTRPSLLKTQVCLQSTPKFAIAGLRQRCIVGVLKSSDGCDRPNYKILVFIQNYFATDPCKIDK